MSKRSFMEIFSGACAEIGRNVSEDLLDLRNQCMAKANDVCTNASATVAAKVSAAVQHCKDECRAFADTARVFGIGGSYATSALGGSYATSALGGSLLAFYCVRGRCESERGLFTAALCVFITAVLPICTDGL